LATVRREVMASIMGGWRGCLLRARVPSRSKATREIILAVVLLLLLSCSVLSFGSGEFEAWFVLSWWVAIET
jgi:hypothetical protein